MFILFFIFYFLFFLEDAVSFGQDPQYLLGDKSQLEHVINIFLSNAIKFSKKDSKILITVNNPVKPCDIPGNSCKILI